MKIIKEKETVAKGDIYAVKLPDGRYGAIVVLEIIEKSFLLATTKYISDKIPKMGNEELRKILIRNRFKYIDSPAISWVEGKKPNGIEYIGNDQILLENQKYNCSTYSGKWTEDCCIDVFYEWRWNNDRENFEQEIAERRKQDSLKIRIQKPKKMMDEEIFWNIINKLDWKNKNDDDEVVKPVIEYLSKLSVKEIKEFQERFSFMLYKLDTKEIAENTGEFSYKNRESFSEDMFLYSRCCVIANGKELFSEILNEPEKMIKNIEFERLLYVAEDAYEMKKGKSLEYETGCSYETYSNSAGWK